MEATDRARCRDARTSAKTSPSRQPMGFTSWLGRCIFSLVRPSSVSPCLSLHECDREVGVWMPLYPHDVQTVRARVCCNEYK